MFSLKDVSSLLDVWFVYTFIYKLNGFINEECSFCKTPFDRVLFVDNVYLGVKKHKLGILESPHVSHHYAMILIGILTMAQLFPYRTENFTLHLARVIMKTNYLVFVQDLPFICALHLQRSITISHYVRNCQISQLPVQMERRTKNAIDEGF